MRMLGVADCHRVVVVSIHRRVDGTRYGNILTSSFYRPHGWWSRVRAFGRVRASNDFAAAPSVGAVGAVLRKQAGLVRDPGLQFLQCVSERGSGPLSIERHYFACDAADFWSAPAVAPHVIGYRVSKYDQAVRLEGTDHFLGIVAKQLRDVIFREYTALRAA